MDSSVVIDDDVMIPVPAPGERWAVGAIILNERGEVFAQRRSLDRRLFPGCWDVVGGHVEHGETLLEALVREVNEETGWQVTRVRHFLGVVTWIGDDGIGERQEADFLVDVSGDLTAPQLEWSKHPEYRWLGPADVDRLKDSREPAEQLVFGVAAKALAFGTGV